MKYLLAPLLVWWCSIGAAAQFAGVYKVPATDKQPDEVCLVLEESGRFQFFAGYHYWYGQWHQTDESNVVLEPPTMDAVAVYVCGRQEEQARLVFAEFGNKRAFLSIGNTGRGEKSFMPVFKEEPQCSYETSQSITLPRNDFNEITIALDSRPQAKADGKGPLAVYTYAIPASYSNIYIVADDDAFLEQRRFTITRKNKQYSAGDIIFKKQDTDLRTLPKLIADQLALSRKARIAQFRKKYYVKQEIVMQVDPQISRQVISATADPLFTIDCPEPDPFPPVVPVEAPTKRR